MAKQASAATEAKRGRTVTATRITGIVKVEGPRGTAYLARVEYPRDPVTGKRKQRAESFATMREAEKARAKWLTEIDNGTAVDTTKITTGEYLTHWLTTAAKHAVRETSYLAYETTIRVHLIPGIGSVPLQRLTPAIVQAFYADALATGHSPAVVYKCHLRLSQALKQAVKWQLVIRNVCNAVDAPRVTHKQSKTWTVQEARTFLAGAEHDTYHPYWLLALTTGMRRGELLGLRWQDVDFERHRVHVRQTVTVGAKGVPIFQEPKTAKARRAIPVPPTVTAALRAHRTRQLARRLTVGAAWRDYDLVFCVADGGPVNPGNVLRNMRAIAKRASVPPLNIHSMRHTHATLLLADGQNAKVVQERLGHANIALTLTVYGHVIPGMQEAASDAIGAALFGEANTGGENSGEAAVKQLPENEKTVG